MTGTSMLTRDVSIADAAIVGVGLDAQVIQMPVHVCICRMHVESVEEKVRNRIHILTHYTFRSHVTHHRLLQ